MVLDPLLSQLETDCKMVGVIADTSGVLHHIVEGCYTADEMQSFIETKFKVPKKSICDGAGYMLMPGAKNPGGIVGWKYAKGESVGGEGSS